MAEFMRTDSEVTIMEMIEKMKSEVKAALLQNSEKKEAETAESFLVKDENMRTEAAAAYLQVKSSTLCQWRWSGRGPLYCRVGRICIYRRSDLDLFLASNTFRSTTEAQSARN